MKNFIRFSLLIIVLFSVLFFRQPIINWTVKKILFSGGIIVEKNNDYDVIYDFVSVQNTEDFYAKNKKHLYNIIYTGLNYGNDFFDFFCDYENCIDDVNEMSNGKSFLHINNFIHPYNSYRKLSIIISGYGKISIAVEKTYSKQDIEQVSKKIDNIEDEIINNNMTDIEKIKSFHDYIINNTSYDSEYVDLDLNDIYSPSHNALGPLFHNKSLCGGYTDVMAIFLERLDIPNYRIASEQHIWNFLYINNKWLHLDLTWDDPVTNDKPVLIDKFFLINTKKLKDFDTEYHTFNEEVYKEASYK